MTKQAFKESYPEFDEKCQSCLEKYHNPDCPTCEEQDKYYGAV